MNQMKKLNEDIVRMKKEHCETQDRVTRLEVLVHEQRRTDKRVDKQHERISDLKQLIDTSLSIGHECRQRIGEMNQLTTNRINSVELLMRQNKPQIVQHVQGENTSVIPNTDAHVDPTRQQKVHSVPAPTRVRSVPIPDVTIVNDDNTRHVKLVPTKRDAKKNSPYRMVTVQIPNDGNVDPGSEYGDDISDDKSGEIRTNTADNVNGQDTEQRASSPAEPVTKGPTDSNQDVTQPQTTQRAEQLQYQHPSKAEQDESANDDVLEGFIPQKHRQRLTPLYAAGIVVKGNTDKAIQSIKKYLEDNDIYVRSIRYIKEKGNTLAVKIVTTPTDAKSCLNDGFWPKGIWCRKWQSSY